MATSLSDVIKISELDDMLNDSVRDSDHLIIDNGNDTYKISIEELKIVFGLNEQLDIISKKVDSFIDSTKKEIDDMKDTLEKEISNISSMSKSVNQNVKTLTEIVDTMQGEIDALRDRCNSMENVNSTNSQNIEELQLNLVTIGQNISKTNNDISSLNTSMSNLSNLVNTFDNRISTNTNSISNIQSSITNLENKQNNDISSVNSKLTELVENKYLSLKEQIDYWHHSGHGGASSTLSAKFI